MATRTLIIDLSKGTGGEPMYGMVTVQRTRATSEGTFEVLPWETKLKLFNGIATITEAVTDGSGPFYDSAYLIRVQNGYCAPRWGFMAALPDGTTPISTGDMPKVNPITGEGIYMDAQEWNALYGTLPDRVTSLENSQSVQDGKIATLQTGKANTVHTHVIGDVTGLQPALNAKGNATMRVDTTVGTRVFITDGVTEKMVSGDTGRRKVIVAPTTSYVLSGEVRYQRVDERVYLYFNNVLLDTAGSGYCPIINSQDIPQGFRMIGSERSIQQIGLANNATAGQTIAIFTAVAWLYTETASGQTPTRPTTGLSGSVSWITNDPWPTTLPGTPA